MNKNRLNQTRAGRASPRATSKALNRYAGKECCTFTGTVPGDRSQGSGVRSQGSGVRGQGSGVRSQESEKKFSSFPGSSLGTFSSCGFSRFFKMWLEPQIKDIPRLEPGNKRKHHNRDSPIAQRPSPPLSQIFLFFLGNAEPQLGALHRGTRCICLMPALPATQ